MDELFYDYKTGYILTPAMRMIDNAPTLSEASRRYERIPFRLLNFTPKDK